ncbi:MAG: hypothetical protein IJ646_10235 [Clostridia bacterium]|nr:hypothetical protein [Clostridia bacterium]
MSIVGSFIEAAQADRPVYICDIRDAFQREGTRAFHIHARLYDDSVRRYALRVPACDGAAEARFVEEYLTAMLYNMLSSLGAKAIAVYVDSGDAPLLGFACRLNDIFQTDVPIAERRGYGKCLNVNQRTLASLTGGEVRFAFSVADAADEPEEAPAPAAPAGKPVFASLPERAKRGLLMGMDVGGTDVKVAASVDGRLCVYKEYDWDPASLPTVERLIAPLMLLTRLTRAAACLVAEGLGEHVPGRPLNGPRPTRACGRRRRPWSA